jgi:hypothetical protein
VKEISDTNIIGTPNKKVDTSIRSHSKNYELESKLSAYKYSADMRRKSGSRNPGTNTSYSKDDLSNLKQRVEILTQRFEDRETDFEKLKEVIENNENDKFGFLFTLDEFLRTIDLTIEAVPTIDSVGKHSYGAGGSSGAGGRADDERHSNRKLKELQ